MTEDILQFPKPTKKFRVTWNRQTGRVYDWPKSRMAKVFGIDNEGIIVENVRSSSEALHNVAKEHKFTSYYLIATEIGED